MSHRVSPRDRSSRMIKIPSTSWHLVETTQGDLFYYEPTRKISIWEPPEDLKAQLAQLPQQELLRLLRFEEQPDCVPPEAAPPQDEDEFETDEAMYMTQEEKEAKFLDLLTRHKVNPYGAYELEMEKVQKDPAFGLLGLSDKVQRRVFTSVCKALLNK